MSSVDVIVPCYNYGRYLRQCVESVLSQEGVDVRVLIIDDASPDETPEVAADLTARDPRVSSRRHAVNQGHVATYNEGLLDWASAEYCVLLSADDGLPRGALSKACRLLAADLDLAFVHGRSIRLEGSAPMSVGLMSPDLCSSHVCSGTKFIGDVCTSTYNPVNAATVVVRTNCQKKVGGYSPELRHTCDMEMWLRLAMNGQVGFLDAPQAFGRVHGESMSKVYFSSVMEDVEQRALAFDFFFRANANRLVDGLKLQARVNKELARQALWAASQAFDDGEESICQAALALAAELCPELYHRSEWSRLRWKKRLGMTVWRHVRPVVDPLR